MLKYIHKITVLAILLLFISAFTMCPAMANEYSSLPSYGSIDSNYSYYTFTTPAGEQGLVLFCDGIVQEISIGDKCARIIEDAPSYLIVDAFDDKNGSEYQLVYWKDDNSISIIDNNSEGSQALLIDHAALLSSKSQMEDAIQDYSKQVKTGLVSSGSAKSLEMKELVTESIENIIESNSPAKEQTIYIGMTLIISFAAALTMPYTSVILVVGILLANENGVQAVVQFAVGAEVLLIAGAVCIGIISIAEIQKQVKQSEGGVYQFAVEKDGEYYLYEYSADMKKEAKFIRKVSKTEGDMHNILTQINLINNNAIRFINEKIQQAIIAVKSWIGTVEKFIQTPLENIMKQENCVTCNQKNSPNLEDRKYYEKTEYYTVKNPKNINEKDLINSYEEAVKTLSDCRGPNSEKIFIFGSSEDDCIKLCDDASKKVEGSGHKLDGYHEKGKGQYKHCHAKDKDGHPCNPHCIYGESNING